jgi:anti-sigma regulatory factor (Ser/Thr protein kinase)
MTAAPLWRIECEADVVCARGEAQKWLESRGVSRVLAAETALIVSELGQNIVKYGKLGSIQLRWNAQKRGDLDIEATDSGPGFSDLNRARMDGTTSAGPLVRADGSCRSQALGLGLGLGAVERLSRRMSLRNRPEGGAQILVQKMLYPG